MGERCLITNDFRDHGRYEIRVLPHLRHFFRELIQKHYATRHRVPGRVITPDNQEHDIAHVGQRVIHHVFSIRVGLKQANQIKRFFTVAFSLMPQLSETLQAGCDVFDNDLASVALTGCDSDIRGKHV